MNKSIHIISFSIPYPANYGGAIDVYYKIKTLAREGYEITLHCFQYDRKPAKELQEYCKDVYYYSRKMVGSYLLGFHPFIVSSRKSEELIKNLLKDNAPILFEGLHTCYSIGDNRLKDRLKIVRSHNLEHDYYLALAKVERRPIKRMYFKSESKKLKKFEEVAYKKANFVLGISQKDTKYLNDKYHNSILVSAFHGFEKVNIPILGIVGNMSIHICSKCNHAEEIFGHGGGKYMAKNSDTNFLGALPLQLNIRTDVDEGVPSVAKDPESQVSAMYQEIARRVAGELSLKNESVGAFPKITIE